MRESPEDFILREGFIECPPLPAINEEIQICFAIYNIETKSIEYQVSYKNLDDIKQIYYQKLNSWFDQKFFEPCPTSLNFDIDMKRDDQLNWTMCLNSMINFNKTETIVRDYYNNNHFITLEQFKQMCQDLDNYITGILLKKWTIYEIITNTTEETIQNLVDLNFDLVEINVNIS